MCLPDNLLSCAPGASLTSLFIALMEYPLPGPVIALLSQEKAALAPKSYLISSCKKSIKITLVYAKDQQNEEGQHLVPSSVASASTSGASGSAVTAAAAVSSMPSKASSASSLMSSSSSLSSSAERKKPRHASSSSKTSRKKKKRSKKGKKSSRSTPSSIIAPRVSKLSESSTSPTSDLEALCSGTKNNDGLGTIQRNRQTELPPKSNANSGRGEDSCSTPEFPLFFGGRDGDINGRERMSTVDSGVPSSNGTMAQEQTAESGASDDDNDTQGVAGTFVRRGRPAGLSEERLKPEVGQSFKKSNEPPRVLPVDLPRRTRGISDSSISSLSSSEDNGKGESTTKNPPKVSTNNTKTTCGPTTVTASASRTVHGSETPVRREEQWQTWTRIPRTHPLPTYGRQKSMVVPSVSARPPTTSIASRNAGGGAPAVAPTGGAPRVPAHSNLHTAANGSAANQSEGGGASWDGSENL